MQSLAKETILPASPLDCSAQLIELTPVIMRRIRNEMRSRTLPGLTIPQFRALNYLQIYPRSSLSDVAGHLGFSLPSTSKLVQNLVKQKVIVRRNAPDRRRVCLSLTQQGITALVAAHMETQKQLAEILGSLTQSELSAVLSVLRILNKAFTGGGAGVNIS